MPASALLRLDVVIFSVATGVTVIVELEILVLSATLVAVTTAEVSVVTSGAVYSPLDETRPIEEDQRTPVLSVFSTVAVNC